MVMILTITLIILLVLYFLSGFLKIGDVKYINIPFTGYGFRISKVPRDRKHYDSY